MLPFKQNVPQVEPSGDSDDSSEDVLVCSSQGDGRDRGGSVNLQRSLTLNDENHGKPMYLLVRETLARAWNRPKAVIKNDYMKLTETILDLEEYVSPEYEEGITYEIIMEDRTNVEKDWRSFIAHNAYILAQLYPAAIESLIVGDLPIKFETDRTIQQCVTKYETGRPKLGRQDLTNIPLIYINYIADSQSAEAVPCATVERLCDWLEPLTSDSRTSQVDRRVDLLTRKLFEMRSQAPCRDFFLDHKGKNWTPETARQEVSANIKEWIIKMREHAKHRQSIGTVPMCEVGLTQRGDARLHEHAICTNTSPLTLKLARCVLALIEPGKYCLYQYIVVFPTSDWTLGSAENLISILAGSYVKAGGMNIAGAGKQTKAGKLTANDWKKVREKLEKQGAGPRSEQNIQNYNDQVDQWAEAVDSKTTIREIEADGERRMENLQAELAIEMAKESQIKQETKHLLTVAKTNLDRYKNGLAEYIETKEDSEKPQMQFEGNSFNTVTNLNAELADTLISWKDAVESQRK